jgi:hypothetical protein
LEVNVVSRTEEAGIWEINGGFRRSGFATALFRRIGFWERKDQSEGVGLLLLGHPLGAIGAGQLDGNVDTGAGKPRSENMCIGTGMGNTGPFVKEITIREQNLRIKNNTGETWFSLLRSAG